MISPKQIAANRRNAKKSTGPSTPHGKSKVSLNAFKHGLLAKETVLPWENHDDFRQFEAHMTTSLNPEGALETILVDRITSITWRLRRAGRIETGILAQLRYSMHYEMLVARKNATQSENEYQKWLDSAEDSLKIQIEDAIQSMSDLPELGRIFIDCADSISTLNRYETGLERSLFKALHEFQRIQAARKGTGLPAPVAVDVHGDFER